MRGIKRIVLLAAVFAAALAIAGCGSDDEGTIPSGQSDTLLSLLSQVENSVSNGDCELAQKNAAELVDIVNSLPSDVDNEVQSALIRASEQLVNLASNPEQCVDEGTSGAEGVETTDTTATDTTVTEETTTVEEPTTPEEPTTTEEPAAPQDETPTEDPNIAPGNGQGNQGVGGGNGGPATGGVEPGGKR